MRRVVRGVESFPPARGGSVAASLRLQSSGAGERFAGLRRNTMQKLNEVEVDQVSGAVTEGGCIPETPIEKMMRELLESLTGQQQPTY